MQTRRPQRMGTHEIEIVRETPIIEPEHKLSKEERKQRRADNAATKKSWKQHRRRRKHGR